MRLTIPIILAIVITTSAWFQFAEAQTRKPEKAEESTFRNAAPRDLGFELPSEASNSSVQNAPLPSPTTPVPASSFDDAPVNRLMPQDDSSSQLFGPTLDQDRKNAGEQITITYAKEVTRKVSRRDSNGKQIEVPITSTTMENVVLSIDQNLDELDLPPDGKRIAVLMITAKRHAKLLQALKDAKTKEEKEKASAALKENYTEHYAIETWWREQKLKELEQRLQGLRDQVKQRTDSQEKYVEAAMTIAGLHADGIAIAPPKPASPQPAGNTWQQPGQYLQQQQPPYQPRLPQLSNELPGAGNATNYNTVN